MTHPRTNDNCPNTHDLGPVGCQTAPDIFPLANELAKGKCFGIRIIAQVSRSSPTLCSISVH